MPFRRLMTWSRGAHLTTEELALFDRLYRMDEGSQRRWLERLVTRLSTWAPDLRPEDLLLDVPPRDKDSQPDIEVQLPSGHVTTLQAYSEVVAGIGADFSRHVKRIRLFVHPVQAERLDDHRPAVQEAIAETLTEF